MGYADDTTIYAIIRGPLLRPQVMKSAESKFGSYQLPVFEMTHEA